MENSIKPNHEKFYKAIQQRASLLEEPSLTAIRLFNGFLEGDPRWVIELFGNTLVINDHSRVTDVDLKDSNEIAHLYLQWLPELQSILYKHRYASQLDARQGKLVYGDRLTDCILEQGVRYAIDLKLNQDSSFYLDTRYLRTWLLENMIAKRVLNTFAYTGSLGVAALAGNAEQVQQNDLNRRFLNLAKKSCVLNKFPVEKMKFLIGDFYKSIANLKKSQQLFDCVILDPPFFSATDAGRVDLVNQNARLINKVKPLVAHQGWLVVVNNALFLSGQAFMEMLEELCKDGYTEINAIIPVPQDVIGFPETIVSLPPVSPAPFNHTTKIVVLKIKRKDESGVVGCENKD